jgi:hypothetical protein
METHTATSTTEKEANRGQSKRQKETEKEANMYKMQRKSTAQHLDAALVTIPSPLAAD